VEENPHVAKNIAALCGALSTTGRKNGTTAGSKCINKNTGRYVRDEWLDHLINIDARYGQRYNADTAPFSDWSKVEKLWEPKQGEAYVLMNVLVHGNFAKFCGKFGPAVGCPGNDPMTLHNELRGVGRALIAEASPIDDNYGIALPPNHPDVNKPTEWRGFNCLGEALKVVQYAIFVKGSQDHPPILEPRGSKKGWKREFEWQFY